MIYIYKSGIKHIKVQTSPSTIKQVNQQRFSKSLRGQWSLHLLPDYKLLSGLELKRMAHLEWNSWDHHWSVVCSDQVLRIKRSKSYSHHGKENKIILLLKDTFLALLQVDCCLSKSACISVSISSWLLSVLICAWFAKLFQHCYVSQVGINLNRNSILINVSI